MAVARDLAAAALRPWEQEINLYHFTPVSDIAFDFKSGKNPPFYEISTVMWTFLSVYLDQNMQNFWSEVSWITRLDPDVVGVGKVYAVVGDRIAARNDPVDHSTQDNFSRNLSASIAVDQMVGSDLPTLQHISPSTVIGSRGLALGLGYVRNGRSFQVQDVFTAVFWLIITAAPYDSKEPALTMGRYDPEANLTLSVCPWHDVDEFKWWMAIESLWMLLDLMLDETPGGRWAEARARLRVDGVNQGKLFLVKGRMTPDELESAFDDLGEEGFDTDITNTGNVASTNVASPGQTQTYETS